MPRSLSLPVPLSLCARPFLVWADSTGQTSSTRECGPVDSAVDDRQLNIKLGLLTPLNYDVILLDSLSNVLPSVETPWFQHQILQCGTQRCVQTQHLNIFHLNESQLDPFARVLWLGYIPYSFCSNFITALHLFIKSFFQIWVQCRCRHIRSGECEFRGPDNLHIICMSYDVSSLQIYL